jgi:hypothetical protein
MKEELSDYNAKLMLEAVVIAQSLAEVQAELRRFVAESESWPAFDNRHQMLKVLLAAAGDPIEESINE